MLRAGYGTHARALVVLDACAPPSRPDLVSGVLAGPPPPYHRFKGERVDPRDPKNPPRRWQAPAQVDVFTAGIGPGCTETLPGATAPALAYLLLGAIGGWADRDGDHMITTAEVVAHLDALWPRRADPPDGLQLEVHGPNLALATGAGGRGPDPHPGESGQAHRMHWLGREEVDLDETWFKIGCAADRDGHCEADEKPSRSVWVSRMQLDRTEVTQAAYLACVDAGRCSAPDLARCHVWTGSEFKAGAKLPAALLGPRRPAICVTWAQAERYCAWRGKRLPTEVEWERAARGAARRIYAWGDERPTCERAQFHDCGDRTREVGTTPRGATPEGLQDMSGNVAEWVADWYSKRYYRNMPRADPMDRTISRVRTIRGGSYYEDERSLRASYRYALTPTFGYSFVGFRCAR